MPRRRPRKPPSGAGIAAETGATELARRVGERIRALRRERGLSVGDLALHSGVSKATLSQLESSKTNPTIAILWRIAAALGIPFQALLGHEAVGRMRVLRRGAQRGLRSGDGRLESRPLSPPGALSNVEIYELCLAPRAVHASPAHASGTLETVVVLVGHLRVRVGEETCDLGPGDSLSFRADEPHAYENRGRTGVRCHDVVVYRP
jgi:transcriptional regulator with XRE-family HTH domain